MRIVPGELAPRQAPASEPAGWFRDLQGLAELLPSLVTIPLVVVALWYARAAVERHDRAVSGHRFRGQVLMLGLSVLGAIAIIVALPIGVELRKQLLSFLGILLSAAIALASTSFLGNIMAGFQLRSLRNFRIGDFVRIEDHFGRVTERGLFHTEIQTEDRDLTTLPNMYLATKPMTVIRASGTIVSADVSLGYDVSRRRVRQLLLGAAEEAGLADPFLRVVGLGDYSVEYRVGGLLTEVKELLSTRTRLRSAMLDALHEGGVEIVSPLVMSTRAFEADRRFVPARPTGKEAQAAGGLEALAFDKADEAESLEQLRGVLARMEQERKELEGRRKEAADPEARAELDRELERLGVREARLREAVEARAAAMDD